MAGQLQAPGRLQRVEVRRLVGQPPFKARALDVPADDLVEAGARFLRILPEDARVRLQRNGQLREFPADLARRQQVHRRARERPATIGAEIRAFRALGQAVWTVHRAPRRWHS